MTTQPGGIESIGRGAILIAGGTPLPEPLTLESAAVTEGWARVGNSLDGPRIEQALASAGWVYFYMAGNVRAIGFGVEGALKRLIRTVSLQKCNCVEIDAVTRHSFWGMPYFRVSAHARHIQQTAAFAGQEATQ